jgi:phosphatidylserine/phosphatidylglycerophosphate/cardiolipin synthase-like enzyme
MLHTKMIVTEDWISFGSTNITKKAFQQLNELNIFLKNVDSEVKTKLMQSMQENHALSEKINTYKRIKYNAFAAFVEGFLV